MYRARQQYYCSFIAVKANMSGVQRENSSLEPFYLLLSHSLPDSIVFFRPATRSPHNCEKPPLTKISPHSYLSTKLHVHIKIIIALMLTASVHSTTKIILFHQVRRQISHGDVRTRVVIRGRLPGRERVVTRETGKEVPRS